MMFSVVLLALLGILIDQSQAHSKWICPKPRVDNSGLKTGPCGGQGDINDASLRTTLAPGPFTVYFQETIFHRGAPWRVALSIPGQDDYEQCILLDHVPHNDAGAPNQIHGVTIDIPDFQCDNCALQVIQFMTDKVNGQCTFNPADTNNFANGQCGSNYFSCANVKITGSKPFNTSECVQPTGFSRSYHYLSTEAADWSGLYLASHGDASVRTPVVGSCSIQNDPAIAAQAGVPFQQGTNSGAIAAGILVPLAALAGIAVFRNQNKRRAMNEPIVHDDKVVARPVASSASHHSSRSGGQLKAVPDAFWGVEPAYNQNAAANEVDNADVEAGELSGHSGKDTKRVSSANLLGEAASKDI